MRVRGLTAALLVIIATAAAAQTPGSYEINGFGRYTRFDNTLGPNNEFGGGGSLGFFLLSNLALEAEGAYTATQDGLSHWAETPRLSESGPATFEICIARM
jgi:hypothetical protein